MKSEPGEITLLRGLAKNERMAVETIYAKNYGMVQALIINNNGTSDDARDIFQESIIVLYEKVRQPGFELHCQIKTYLYSVARRLWLKRLNQMNRYIPQIRDAEEVVPAEDDIELHERQNEEFLVMERALGSIGEPCRSLLHAFYVEKRNMADIAQGFGYTNPENAKNQKYKCLIRLRKLFFSEYKNNNV